MNLHNHSAVWCESTEPLLDPRIIDLNLKAFGALGFRGLGHFVSHPFPTESGACDPFTPKITERSIPGLVENVYVRETGLGLEIGY